MSRKLLKQISEQYFEELFGLQPTKYTLKKECSGMIGQAYFDDIKVAFYPEYTDEQNYSVIVYMGLDAIDKVQSKNIAFEKKSLINMIMSFIHLFVLKTIQDID